MLRSVIGRLKNQGSLVASVTHQLQHLGHTGGPEQWSKGPGPPIHIATLRSMTTAVDNADQTCIDAASSRFKIYTRTGDKGQASLFNGQRASKDTDVFAALGDVDELNSSIGVAKEYCRAAAHNELVDQLDDVQSRLLDIGSVIATPASSSSAFKLKRVAFNGEHYVITMEGWLDAMDDELPPLRNFILPGGGKAASFLHHARSVCRRAERSLVTLLRQEGEEPSASLLAVCAYINRLSDYLFVAARFAAVREGHPEQVYKKATE